jgi:4-amino-4-deoxy-L-arabinose transferase-like glycosyltransferase
MPMLKSRRFAAALPWAAAAGAAALHVAASLRTPLGAASDDALHLLLARNLLSGGYAVPDAAGVPVTDPLPGFAFLMAVPEGLLSPHWGLLRGAALLATGALAFAVWRLARRLSGEAAAWAAFLLVALNPTLIGWAGVALPDIPFAAVAAGAFLLMTLDDVPVAALTVLAGAASLLRPEGVILVAAVAAGLGFRHGPKRAGLFFFGALAPLALWLLRNRLAAGTPTAYVDHWRELSAYSGKSFVIRAATLAAGLGRGLFGSLPAPAAFAGLLTAAAAAGAGARLVWRSRVSGGRAYIVAAAVYWGGLTALHLGWGAWQSRYALAFFAAALPLWGAAFAGLRAKRASAALAVLALLAAPGLYRAADFAREGVSDPRSEMWPRTAHWLRQNVPAGAGIISTEPYLVALTTGRRAYFPPGAVSREAWIAELRSGGVRYVLVRPHGERAFLSGGARSLLSDFDDWAVPSPPLTLAFSDEDEASVVLHLD